MTEISWFQGRSSPAGRGGVKPAAHDYYGVARKVAGFIIVIGWLSVALGVVLMAVGLPAMLVLFSSPLSLGLMAIGSGLFDVAAGYVLRAAIDTAENTGDILDELRILVERPNPGPRSESASEPEPAPRPPEGDNSCELRLSSGEIRTFATWTELMAYVDALKGKGL
jgi:hypothetical protein